MFLPPPPGAAKTKKLRFSRKRAAAQMETVMGKAARYQAQQVKRGMTA